MKWVLLAIAGLLTVAAVLIATNWEYLYEELIIDPIGIAKLAESIEASPCADHHPKDTTEGWRYDVNYSNCYEIDTPLDWSGSRYLDHPEYQSIVSRESIDGSDDIPFDYNRWDGGQEYTLEIETYDVVEKRGNHSSLDAWLMSEPARYQAIQQTTLGGQPALRVTETLPDEQPHEVTLCEYRGKIVLIRIGAGEYDRVNRPHVDRAIQSFRFLPEFGTSK